MKARNKQKLEMESGCKIVVPKREELEDCVYLRARQKQQIYSCKALIELLCEKEEAKLEDHELNSIYDIANSRKYNGMMSLNSNTM